MTANGEPLLRPYEMEPEASIATSWDPEIELNRDPSARPPDGDLAGWSRFYAGRFYADEFDFWGSAWGVGVWRYEGGCSSCHLQRVAAKLEELMPSHGRKRFTAAGVHISPDQQLAALAVMSDRFAARDVYDAFRLAGVPDGAAIAAGERLIAIEKNAQRIQRVGFRLSQRC